MLEHRFMHPGHTELYNVQLLRAIAVLLVAAFHLELYIVWLSPVSERYLLPFGYSGVDLFFTISGFINYYISASHFGDGRYSWRFLAKRIIRIFPNYWIFVSLTLLLVAYAGMHPLPDMIRYVESYLLIYPLRVPEHILITGWTLNYELLFYCGFAILMCFPRLLWPATIIYALVIIAAQNSIEHWNAARLWEFALAPYFLQFFAGMTIAKLALKRSMPLPCTAITIGLGFFALAWWMQLAVYPETFANPFHRDLRVMLYLCAYAPILYGLVSLELSKQYICRNKMLLLFGDASYTLYLLFMPYFYACWLLWKQLIGDYGPIWQAVFVFTPLTAISYLVLGCLHYRYVERPMIDQLKRRLLP